MYMPKKGYCNYASHIRAAEPGELQHDLAMSLVFYYVFIITTRQYASHSSFYPRNSLVVEKKENG